MRLTADLIANSPSYMNPVRDRELDLRSILFVHTFLFTIDQRVHARVLLAPTVYHLTATLDVHWRI